MSEKSASPRTDGARIRILTAPITYEDKFDAAIDFARNLEAELTAEREARERDRLAFIALAKDRDDTLGALEAKIDLVEALTIERAANSINEIVKDWLADFNFRAADAGTYLHSHISALTPDPAAQALGELRANDARYLWLREMAQLGAEDDYSSPYIKMRFPRVPKNLNGYVWDAPCNEKLDAKIDAAIVATGDGKP